MKKDFHTVMAELDRAGVPGGLTFQAPTVTLDPGVPTAAGLADPRACASSTAGGSAPRETIATSPLPSGPTWMTRRGAGLASDGLAGIATVARLGVRGPSKGTSSPTACAVPSPSPLLSSARTSSAYYVTNGPRRAGRTPSRTPTSTRGADAWRRIAPKLSMTWDFKRGASTKRRYFWLGGLLAVVLGV